MGKVMSRVCECDICGKEMLTNRELLPEGWFVLWDVPYTICDDCADKWASKWGSLPMYLIKGSEKELVLL